MRSDIRTLIGTSVLLACLWSTASDAATHGQQRAVACTWIRTIGQLQAIQNNLTGAYCLANNIDARSVANFTPIGSLFTPFGGRFYGNGFAIVNLRINSSAQVVGLFGGIDGAVIQDVALLNVKIASSAVNGLVGALAGSARADFRRLTILRVRTGGKVECTGSNCSAGGIFGNFDDFNGESTLSEASSSADVVGGFISGGIAGYLDSGSISRTYATGSVVCTLTNCTAGGLVGQSASGAVELSFATGAVTAAGGEDSRAGGLIGSCVGTATVSRAFASGAVTIGATGFAGGLMGQHNGTSADQTYAIGPVSGGAGNTGGLMANASGVTTITNSYWDVDTSGQATSDEGTAQTTAQLRAGLPSGFDGSWAITANRSYPFLNEFDIDFASPLATLVRSNNVFTFLPINQRHRFEYLTNPAHADQASLAAVYTMIARAIGITKNVFQLKAAAIDKYFWDDATQTVTWQGPVTNHATLGRLRAIPAATPLNGTNVIRSMNTRRLVALRGVFRRNDGRNARHWLLGTLYTRASDNSVSAVVAHDPWTGRQVLIDPQTKKVLSPAGFPLTNFKVDAYRPVTLN